MPTETATRIRSTKPSAIVIGGGATGCAVARDLSLRGFAVTLVDQGDLGSGTSSRFHGMLQSGARYAVSDTGYAAECMRERRIVADLIPSAVEPTGGLFVSLENDPDDYAEKFKEACGDAKIPVEELNTLEVMAGEPSLSRSVKRAFAVPDATINPWWLVNGLAKQVRNLGGTVLLRHRVTNIASNGSSIDVYLKGSDGAKIVASDVVVNAAGAWSGEIAAQAGQSVALELTKGSIIVLAHRVVRRVINRCRYPSSHDIIVPTGTISLFGTTSQVVSDPGTTSVQPKEIQELLEGAAPLIPDIRDLGVLRAWAGVRPLIKPHDWPAGKPVPRRHKVIDHGATGFAGLFTVCGGSLTTHRSMAEDVCNQVCNHVGWNAPCETAMTPIEPNARHYWSPAASYDRSEERPVRPESICECEAVALADVAAAISQGIVELHDLRRRLRIGFGPCQGTFCGPRVAELLARTHTSVDSEGELNGFWAERLKGMVLTGWGKQARQILLSEHVHRGLLGLESGHTSPESVNSC